MMKFIYTLFTSLFLFITGCSNKCEFEFCFSTVVNGSVGVEAFIGDVHTIPGSLSSFNGPLSNAEYNFEKLENRDLCGATACCYHMEPPDSAYLKWGNASDGKSYKKKLKLPPYPKLKYGEMYRISFAIAYQDCVYCKIEAVKK